jgi:hypothetical protein
VAKEEKLQGDKYISNGIERGQMTLVVMKINNTISGGKQGNFNYNGRTLRMTIRRTLFRILRKNI